MEKKKCRNQNCIVKPVSRAIPPASYSEAAHSLVGAFPRCTHLEFLPSPSKEALLSVLMSMSSA